MYCSTCGARVPPGRTSCDTCGASLRPRIDVAPLPRDATSLAAGTGAWAPAVVLRNCPRCGYRGEGITYFSRGSHMAGLVVATVFTAGAMGAGGLVYYLLRRDHQVCPRCGRTWGRNGERALVRTGAASPAEGGAPLPIGRDGAPRAWSMLLFVFAALLMVVGIAEMEAIPFLMGMVAAGGGFALHRHANRARAERRAALISSLQLPVLKLAAERGGRLTVTEVAASLGWTLPRAEKVLASLDDGIRVDSEVTDEGLIVYQFRELLPPGRGGGGDLDA